MGDHLYISLNKRGPKTEPCGSPCTIFLSEDVCLYCVKCLFSIGVISANCERLNKEDLNQKFVLPLILYVFNLSSSMLWFRTSFAFVRSRNIPTTCNCYSMGFWMLAMRFWLAESFDFIFLNPFCASDVYVCYVYIQKITYYAYVF